MSKNAYIIQYRSIKGYDNKMHKFLNVDLPIGIPHGELVCKICSCAYSHLAHESIKICNECLLDNYISHIHWVEKKHGAILTDDHDAWAERVKYSYRDKPINFGMSDHWVVSRNGKKL